MAIRTEKIADAVVHCLCYAEAPIDEAVGNEELDLEPVEVKLFRLAMRRYDEYADTFGPRETKTAVVRFLEEWL